MLIINATEKDNGETPGLLRTLTNKIKLINEITYLNN